MGIWWKRVDPRKVPDGGITLDGDPNAWSKWIPILWRFQHKWIILEVESPNNSSYYIYFDANGFCMRYRYLVKTRRVAVRIGSGDVRFVASTPFSTEPLAIRKVYNKNFTYTEIISSTNRELAMRSAGRFDYIPDVTMI